MAYMDLRDPRKWFIIPIHHIRIGVSGGGDYYYNLEDGSQWAFTPVLRQTDLGGDRIVAWKFEGTFIVIQNNYDDMIEGFTHLIDSVPSDFDLYLQPGYSTPWDANCEWNTQANYNVMQISVDAQSGKTINVKSWSAVPEWNQSKESPKLTLKVKGLFSKEIFSNADIFTLTY